MNGQAALLDIITYEDRANARRTFLVTKIIVSSYGIQYGLIDMDTDEYSTSDLRQSGWTFVQNVTNDIAA